jgi:hypothetical protein
MLFLQRVVGRGTCPPPVRELQLEAQLTMRSYEGFLK